MDKYQARIKLLKIISDYLWPLRHKIDFCKEVSTLASEHLSIERTGKSVFIEDCNRTFFLGDLSSKHKGGFGFEYNKDGSLYMGEWVNGKYDGYGYLFTQHLCHYGHFLNGAYDDNNKIIGNIPHFLIDNKL